MNLYLPILVSCAIFFNIAESKLIRTCSYSLHLFNDGPVTLDVPVTISAFLECADDEEDYLYIFQDDEKREIAVSGDQTAGATFIFTNTPGIRTIKVNVYLLYPERVKVASGRTAIRVYEYIPGKLDLSEVVIDEQGLRYVGAGKDTNLSLEIDYPQRVFNDAEFSYFWTVGDSRFISREPYLIHKFVEPGPQSIRASVVARVPSYDDTNSTKFKWGYFDAKVIVKNPFSNINITGNTYLQHGQLLNLEISCSGSGPVDYCWKVLPPTGNHTNLSCSEPVTVMECSFPIIYYFHEAGKFLLAIYIDNVVSSIQRNIEIRIYDVSLRPQLSTVIIPIVCTILVLLIVAGAIVAHVRRRRSYEVSTETADFDFMVTDETGAVIIETSWEHMQRSFLQLLRIPYIYYTTEVQKNYGTIVSQK